VGLFSMKRAEAVIGWFTDHKEREVRNMLRAGMNHTDVVFHMVDTYGMTSCEACVVIERVSYTQRGES
jgi:hypothetical protein